MLPRNRVQVQWYERRANMPAHLQEGMHDREVAEWLQTDTNLVGCIERKARVIKADSFEQVGPRPASKTMALWEDASTTAPPGLDRLRSFSPCLLRLRSSPQALTQLTTEEAAGEWHFCRGVLNCDTGIFKTYAEVDMGELLCRQPC